MTHHFRVTIVLATLLLAAAAAAQQIPPEVVERFESAELPTDSESFVGSFTMSMVTVVQKPNGKGRNESEMVVEGTRAADGEVRYRLLKMVEDGEDVTEKRREKIEKGFNDNDDSDGDEDDLWDPFGEAAERYLIGPEQRDGDAIWVEFEPKPDFVDDQGMATGTVGWLADVHDPLWLEMSALKAPSPLKRLDVRIEYARIGEVVYTSRLMTSGLAKVLIIKREFEMDMRITDVRPAD